MRSHNSVNPYLLYRGREKQDLAFSYPYMLYRGPARFHRLTPNKRFEPMSSTVIMAVCSLFSILLLSTDLITVHLLCRAHCGNIPSVLLNELEQSAIFAGWYITCRVSIGIGKKRSRVTSTGFHFDRYHVDRFPSRLFAISTDVHLDW